MQPDSYKAIILREEVGLRIADRLQVKEHVFSWTFSGPYGASQKDYFIGPTSTDSQIVSWGDENWLQIYIR